MNCFVKIVICLSHEKFMFLYFLFLIRNSKSQCSVHEIESNKHYEINGDDCNTEILTHFYNNTSLESIEILDVSKLTEKGFANCSNLQSVKFTGTNFASLPYMLFYHCINLISINLPEGISRIDTQCFDTCSSLPQIIFPDALYSFGTICFRGCSSLQELEIPSKVNFIPLNIFDGCTSLRKVHFFGDITNIVAYAFMNCKNLKEINFPASLKIIEHYVFAGCISLTSVILPSNVKVIGEASFSGCTHLEYVEIPKSLGNISDNLFANCKKIKSIIIRGNIEIIGTSSFANCNEVTQLRYLGMTNPKCKDNHLHQLNKLPYVEVLYNYPYEDFANLTIFRLPNPSQKINQISSRCSLLFY